MFPPCRSSGSTHPTPLLYTPPATVQFQTPVRGGEPRDHTPVRGGKSPAPPDDVVITPVRSAAPVSERELDSAFAEGIAMMRKDELDLSALNPVLKAIAQDTRADSIVGGSFVASVFAEVVPNSFTLPYNDIDVYKGGFDTTVEYQRVGYSTKDLGLPAPVQYIDCVGLDMSRLAKGVDLNLVDGRFLVKVGCDGVIDDIVFDIGRHLWHFLLREDRAIRAINSATPGPPKRASELRTKVCRPGCLFCATTCRRWRASYTRATGSGLRRWPTGMGTPSSTCGWSMPKTTRSS